MRSSRLSLAAAASAAALALSGCAVTAAAPAPQPSCTGEQAACVTEFDALTTLNELRVAGRAPKTGYSRDQFGPAWSDDVSVAGGGNGCDTRNDVIRRDLTNLTFKPNTRDCVVTSGTLADPYTGKTIAFTRGPDTSDAVQIDHVVALSDAWQKGAQQLSLDRRRDLANDPLNLQAVDGPTNQKKSDSDAASWLPPAKAYRCTYVSRQIQVKATYQLWITQSEKDAMAAVLRDC